MKKRKTNAFAPLNQPVVRNYKDSVFRMIFSEPKELLALYNALNGSSYTDTTRLVIKTLNNAIYMNIKNDVSFIVDNRLSLYEHQSTYTPNMPIRDLIYVAAQVQELVKDEDLYGSSLVQIPTPEFVVFYNGMKELPDKRDFCLSDAYTSKTENLKLELKVTALNINLGHNEKLMQECKTLRDYATYVDKVRTYEKEMNLSEAVQKAVTECIKSDILKEFLLSQKAEAVKMTIYEFDQAKHDETLKKEGETIGEIRGRGLGKAETLLMILSQYGIVPPGYQKMLLQETDIEKLNAMILRALQLQSVERFQEEYRYEEPYAMNLTVPQ